MKGAERFFSYALGAAAAAWLIFATYNEYCLFLENRAKKAA